MSLGWNQGVCRDSLHPEDLEGEFIPYIFQFLVTSRFPWFVISSLQSLRPGNSLFYVKWTGPWGAPGNHYLLTCLRFFKDEINNWISGLSIFTSPMWVRIILAIEDLTRIIGGGRKDLCSFCLLLSWDTSFLLSFSWVLHLWFPWLSGSQTWTGTITPACT